MTRPSIACSVGNLKVGKDTIILNITSATDCESLKKGLCQVPEGKCYALRAEKQYPDVLPYRRKQMHIWDALTPEEIAEDVKAMLVHKRKIPIKFLRMQEAGDFRNQDDLNKMSRLADLLKGHVNVYTYTARKDLNYSRISGNLAINGSGFMISNNFKVVSQLEPGAPACRGIAGGGCYGCKLCKVKGHKVIQELLRGGGKSKNIKDDTSEHGGVARDTKDIGGGTPTMTGVKTTKRSAPKKRKSRKKKGGVARAIDTLLGSIR